MSLDMLIALLLMLLMYSDAAIISEPQSQITFEGQVSVFSCHSNETIFWQINGDLFDNFQTEYLQNLGFSFSDTYSESLVTRKISVVGSRENNNTVITCVSVNSENEVTVSGNATLTVIGSPMLELLNESVFKLSWEGPLTPTVNQPHNYTIRVRYTSGSSQPHSETFTVPVSTVTNTYTFEYPVLESLLPLSTCTQFIFSVLSTNARGDSEPLEVSWEKPQEPGPIENGQCMLKINSDDSMTALVLFTFPELCHFQKVNYSFALSPADTNSHPVASSETRTFVGGGEREVQGQLHDFKLDLNNFYHIRVSAVMLENGEHTRISTPTILCSLTDIKPPSTGGLSPKTEDASSPEVIAGITISAVLLVAVLLMNGVIVLLVVLQRKKHTGK